MAMTRQGKRKRIKKMCKATTSRVDHVPDQPILEQTSTLSNPLLKRSCPNDTHNIEENISPSTSSPPTQSPNTTTLNLIWREYDKFFLNNFSNSDSDDNSVLISDRDGDIIKENLLIGQSNSNKSTMYLSQPCCVS